MQYLYSKIPDDDGFFTASDESETEFWMPLEFYLTWLRRFLAPIFAWVLVRRRFVQVTTMEEKERILKTPHTKKVDKEMAKCTFARKERR